MGNNSGSIHFLKLPFLFIFFLTNFFVKAQDLAYNKDSLAGKKLSLELLKNNLELALKDSSVGWAFSIWKGNKLFYQNDGGYKVLASDTRDGIGLPFTLDTRMHVASLSKSVTAIAVAKLVEMHKMNWEDSIGKYLPSSWKLHPGFASVTIRQLVTMQSGLNGPLDAITSGMDSLKQKMERGPDTSKIGKFNYQNTGYGLLRIIIAYAAGLKEYAGNILTEALPAIAAEQYVQFVNEYIFAPAGILPAACRITESDPALYYPFPPDDAKGVLTGTGARTGGDLTLYAGGFGWYLSADDVGKLLTAVFYSKKILSTTILDQLISFKFPFNIRQGRLGTYFGTGGDWGSPLPGGKWAGIHTYFLCFPGDIRVVVFVNSGEGSPSGKMLRGYRNSFR